MTEIKREIPSQRDGIPKAYDPSNLPDDKAGTEDKWYKYWLDNTPCSIVQKLTKTLNQCSIISSGFLIY